MNRRHSFCSLHGGRLSWPWFVTPVVLGMLIQIFSTHALAIEFIDESATRLPAASDTRLSQITYDSHWGDIDNDGDLDIISINPGGRTLLMNDGNGFFTDETDMRLNGDNDVGGEDPFMADFDLDGDIDIFQGVRAQNAILLINQGFSQGGTLGFFEEQEIVLNSPSDENVPTQAVDAEDVDDDGDLDLILAHATSTITDSSLNQNLLLINQGGLQGGNAGVFVDETATRLPADTSVSFDAEFCDVDGDGDFDVFSANHIKQETGIGQNTLWINQGGLQQGTIGFFVDETSSRLPANDASSVYILCKDVDGDNDIDLAVANIGQSRLLINQGGKQNGTPGFFEDDTSRRFPIDNDNTAVIGLYDFDQDRDLDAFLANGRGPEPQQDRLWLNDGDGVFTDVTADALPSRLNLSNSADGEDFDNDGDIDIYVSAGGRDESGNPLPEMNRLWTNELSIPVSCEPTEQFLIVDHPALTEKKAGRVYKVKLEQGENLELVVKMLGKDSCLANGAEVTAKATKVVIDTEIQATVDGDAIFTIQGEGEKKGKVVFTTELGTIKLKVRLP